MKYSVRRIIFANRNEVRTEQVERQFLLKADDVLLETQYSCISAGTELAKLTGLQQVKYPLCLGNRAIGRVLAVGEHVKHVQPGDLVFAHTEHASHVVTNGLTVKLPEALLHPATATLGMALVAQVAVQTAAPELGDTAIVTGAGLVGQYAAQLLELSGVRVIMSDLSAGRLRIAEQCGISHPLPSNEQFHQRVMELTGGKGAELLLECTGIPALAEQLVKSAAMSATVVLAGSPRGEHHADFSNFLNHFHLWKPHGNLTLKGAHEWKIPRYATPFSKHSQERNVRILSQLVMTEKLKTEPLLSKVYGCHEAAQAYADLQTAKDSVLGAVFDWTGEEGQ